MTINVQVGEQFKKCVCRFVTEIYMNHERETGDPIDP